MLVGPGYCVGSYEIVSAIGAGGIGEVCRARDTKRNRHVALKILPADFAVDDERVARFTREAQLLAALNHPMSIEHTAETLEVSPDTVKRDSRLAKVWSLLELDGEDR